jgi:hypothetical protein
MCELMELKLRTDISPNRVATVNGIAKVVFGKLFGHRCNSGA